MSHAVITASASAYTLAEGPVWDAVRSRLLWVDIEDGRIFSAELRDDGTLAIEETVHIPETVGAVAVSPEGAWVIAGSRGLLFRDTSGRITPGPAILPDESARRLNDGKPDPAGRFLVGSLALHGASSHEILVAIHSDGSLRTIDDDLQLSNGITWSTDGTTLYSVDTERQVVFRRDYDASTGRTGPRQTLLSFDSGYPDGITIDADDHLWIAMWGLGEVRRYSPSGTLAEIVRVPAPHVTCAAFAGPALDTLVITTATQNLTDEQHAQYPFSGHIFTIKPAVGGIPLPLWSGIHRPPTFTRNT